MNAHARFKGRITAKRPPHDLKPDVKYYIAYFSKNGTPQVTWVTLHHRQETQYDTDHNSKEYGALKAEKNWFSDLRGPGVKDLKISDIHFDYVAAKGRRTCRHAMKLLMRELRESIDRKRREINKLKRRQDKTLTWLEQNRNFPKVQES